MLSFPQYKNRLYNYELMKSYLDGKITAWQFRKKYIEQRLKDLDAWSKQGHTHEEYEEELKNLSHNEKAFREKYSSALFNEGVKALKAYEDGLEELNIRGGQILSDIYNFIEWHINDYYPSDEVGFDPNEAVDEKSLYKRINLAYEVLKRNKDRWL